MKISAAIALLFATALLAGSAHATNNPPINCPAANAAVNSSAANFACQPADQPFGCESLVGSQIVPCNNGFVVETDPSGQPIVCSTSGGGCSPCLPMEVDVGAYPGQQTCWAWFAQHRHYPDDPNGFQPGGPLTWTPMPEPPRSVVGPPPVAHP